MANKSDAKDIELPSMPTFYGKDAEALEEYDKRPSTKEEIEILRRADEFYKAQCEKNP